MSLSISLDSSTSTNSIHVLGGSVSGSVRLKSEVDDQAVGSVNITFFGRAKTKIRRSNGQSSTIYKGRADFFRFVRTLYTGKFTFRAGEYGWPFSFDFPDATLQDTQVSQWKPSSGFHSQAGNPLPPSFSCSHHGFSGNYESFIEYKLEASLNRPPESYILFSRGLQAERHLIYSPTRAVENPEPKFKTQVRQLSHASLLLLPENEGRNLTFKEKTRSIFKSGDLPKSSFAVIANIPQELCSVAKIPIFISLEHILERSTAPQPPVVRLRGFTVKIVATTSVRAPRHMSFSGEVTDTTSDKVYIETNDSLSVPMTKHMDLRQYIPNRLEKPLEPSFSTYNICRSYSLELKVIVQCTDKDLSVQFASQNITVLPQLYLGDKPLAPPSTDKNAVVAEERGNNRRDPTSGDGAGPIDENLPQYTPHDPENGVASVPEYSKAGEEDFAAKKVHQLT